jgi:hypothetical protein
VGRRRAKGGNAVNGDLSKLLETARSGYASLVTEQTLLNLYEYAAVNGLIVDRIEPFLFEGELQIPQVHLTLSPAEIHGDYAKLAWGARIAAVKGDMLSMLKETHRIGGTFRFNVGVSSEEEWAR